MIIIKYSVCYDFGFFLYNQSPTPIGSRGQRDDPNMDILCKCLHFQSLEFMFESHS